MVLQCLAAAVCLFYLSYDVPQKQNAADCVGADGGVDLVLANFDRVLRRGLCPCRVQLLRE